MAKAVQSAVQQTADEVVRSVQTTDWKSELAAFTHEVEAEAQKVSHKAVEVSHKAVEVVQHLPAQLHTRTSEVSSCMAIAQPLQLTVVAGIFADMLQWPDTHAVFSTPEQATVPGTAGERRSACQHMLNAAHVACAHGNDSQSVPEAPSTIGSIGGCMGQQHTHLACLTMQCIISYVLTSVHIVLCAEWWGWFRRRRRQPQQQRWRCRPAVWRSRQLLGQLWQAAYQRHKGGH